MLEEVGWDEGWAAGFRAVSGAGLAPGRIVAEHRGSYQLVAQAGEMQAEVAGRMRHDAQRRSEFPAVGDFVAFLPPEGGGPAIIRAVLPRRTQFVRKAAGEKIEEQVVAANIDTVLIVTALDRDFNLRRIERYLAAGWDSGAAPVVVLNKADLCPEVAWHVAEVGQVAPGVPVHVVSAVTGEGMAAFAAYLRQGKTIGLLGSSGVGKSTLINLLLSRPAQATQPVRESDHRGRHTTTHRQLFLVPGGGAVIDTPGMRELQLWNAGEGLTATFGDIEALARQCRFGDCRHVDEPGCAVLDAVRRAVLPADRLKSYRKLTRELDYVESLEDTDAMLDRKRQHRIANKAMKPFKHRN